MVQLCMGSVLKALTICKKDNSVSGTKICETLFPMCYQKIDSGFYGHLVDCTKPVPDDIKNYYRKDDRELVYRNVKACVDLCCQRYIDPDKKKLIILALRYIIVNGCIDDDTVIGDCNRYSKKNLADMTDFVFDDFLANTLVYTAFVDNKSCSNEIKDFDESFVLGFWNKRSEIHLVDAYDSKYENDTGGFSTGIKSEADLERINRLISEINVPLSPIKKPKIISSNERQYVFELFAAYSQRVGKTINSTNDLSEFFITDLEIQRDTFYAAETVRLQGHNALSFIKPSDFLDLKDEMRMAIWDTYSEDYKDGYARLKAVLSQAAVTQCSGSILCKTNWITVPVRKGICHMLAGDKKLHWVKDNE